MYFFFFNDTATTEIYTLSLHDALPIWILFGDLGMRVRGSHRSNFRRRVAERWEQMTPEEREKFRQGSHDRSRSTTPLDSTDRKSTRLNSSHSQISYAVFCLKKKKRITA